MNYRWNTPFSLSCGGLNWCTVAPCQTETGGTTFAFSFSPWALHKTDALPIHPVLLPVSRVSDAVLKPYALLNSTRILPSRPIPAVLCWPRTLGCREGGLHASCVGSKYLHSPSSRVARRRGLDVLGYVKSNPPGRIFNRLSLLEQIFEQIHLRESFLFPPDTDYSQSTLLTIHLTISLPFLHLTKTFLYILKESRDDIAYRNADPHCEHMVCTLAPQYHSVFKTS